MKELKIKLTAVEKIIPTVEVNGKIVDLKKNKHGNYDGIAFVDNDTANVKVYRHLELNSKLWWLKSIFYFIISIFGIFDSMKEKSCIVIDCNIQVDMSNTENATLNLFSYLPKDQSTAFKINSNCTINTISNSYILDKRAKKRKRLLSAIKVLIFICTIVCAVFLIKYICGY